MGSPPREVREGPVHGSLCWSHVCPHQARAPSLFSVSGPRDQSVVLRALGPGPGLSRQQRHPWGHLIPVTKEFPGLLELGASKPGAETRLSLRLLYRLEREVRCK